MKLDRTDLRILAALQTDCSISNLQLAETIGLSAPACLKRVAKLREQGYIEKQVALLNPDIFGRCLHIVIEVIMERDRRELYAPFLARATATKEVKQCYQVAGEVDFVLIATVADMTAYDVLCRTLFDKEPNLRKFRTLISMHRHKFDTSINLPQQVS